jgi:hypothetical protein
VGILSEANREPVLARYRISESTRQSGGMAVRYRYQTEAAEKAVKGRRYGRRSNWSKRARSSCFAKSSEDL